MKKDFEHYYNDWKSKVPLVERNGLYSLNAENLRILCMGFYFCGQEQAREEVLEELKKKLI